MRGLSFEVQERATESAPERVDIACFAGFVRRRPGAPASATLLRFLREEGWGSAPQARVNANDPLDPLLDVPLPFESFSAFERHFAWEARDAASEEAGATYLGAAVRSFFAQGGRKCYVIRVADPAPLSADRTARLALLEKLLPGSRGGVASSAVDRSTWHGATHLYGLPDVSFLCLPDLAELVAPDPQPLTIPTINPIGSADFVECADPLLPTEPDEWRVARAAPRCDGDGYIAWAAFLAKVRALLRLRLREVHFLGALPLPSGDLVATDGSGLAAERYLGRYLHDEGILETFGSAFIQLAYPWVKTPGSEHLPEELESPDGVLAGVLARNALLRGTFRSAMGLGIADLQELEPIPTRAELAESQPGAPATLVERVSLLGPTPRGFRLLSDVTTGTVEAPASRLISAVLRAARTAGLDQVFEPSNEDTWRKLRRRVERVLTSFWEVGALRGTSPQDAFTVRCDRTTMTQDDIDNGRMIAEVELDPVATLQRLQVVLSVAEGVGVSLKLEGA